MFEKYVLACVLMAVEGGRTWWRLLYSGAVQLLLERTREGAESACSKLAILCLQNTPMLSANVAHLDLHLHSQSVRSDRPASFTVVVNLGGQHNLTALAASWSSSLLVKRLRLSVTSHQAGA